MIACVDFAHAKNTRSAVLANWGRLPTPLSVTNIDHARGEDERTVHEPADLKAVRTASCSANDAERDSTSHLRDLIGTSSDFSRAGNDRDADMDGRTSRKA